MIVVNASEYYTVKIFYQFEDGSEVHDPYIAVIDKDDAEDIDITVHNPVVQGYQPFDSLEEDANPAPTTVLIGTLTGDETMTVYYKPELVPYKVRYFLQNIYDDDYTATLVLPESYYEKTGLTGTFPDELNDLSDDPHFDGFTKLYHKPDFIAADGSTEFELYFTRNYYLINFDLDGGHGVEPVYAKYKSPYNIGEPSKKGYVFEGWVLADEDGNFVDEQGNILTDDQARAAATKFTNGTVPDHNVNYKAYWSDSATHYTVVYWIEDADSDEYEDVATQDIYQYSDGSDVMTDDVIKLNGDDKKTVRDFFSYNLNPQKVQKDASGNIVLDKDLRPIYLTNANGEPIDEKGKVLDFPEMSPGEREEFNGKSRYFEINTELTSQNVTVSGDGTTRYNVYYKRKQITQRFFFARKTADGKYQVPGYTKAFSTGDGTLDEHISNKWKGGRTDWMELSDHIPQIAAKYAADNKLTVKEYHPTQSISGGSSSTEISNFTDYTYYYFELTTEYYSNMRDNWLEDAFDPLLITKNKEKGVTGDDYARFGAWSAEWGTPYAKQTNSTVKGVYEKLDEQLLYSEEYLKKSEQNNYGAEPLVLNYLSFWANAKNQNWNKKATYYNFTYQNYVELLPSEYNAQGGWNGTGGYTKVVAVDYDVDSSNQVMHSQRKLYGLLPKNITETYDGGTQYSTEVGVNYSSRDEAIKKNQTPAALTGFALLTDSEIQKVSGASVVYDKDGDSEGSAVDLAAQNPVCEWGPSEGFDADHHCNVKFFYRRRYYSLAFMNNNTLENSSAHTRNIYYQMDINSTGIRGNWVYFEPEYPDADMRDYYVFKGWSFDEDHTQIIPIKENDPSYNGTIHEGKTHFDSDFRMPADDITLFAKWELIKEDVRFYNDYEAYSTGEDPISACQVEYSSMILTKDIPTTNTADNRPDLTPPSEGATFTGWYYVDENGTERRFEPENIPVVNELNLYAKWTSDKAADYKIEYVVRGTDTPVADPSIGVAYVTSTKSFTAKANTELYEAYRPKTGENSWWPITTSHSILIHENEEGKEYEPNTYRFEYYQKGKVWYQVRYLDAATLKPLHEDKVVETSDQYISESFIPTEGYVPDRMQKTLVPAASTKLDADEAKAEELSMNTIVFLYTKNDTSAPVRIEYYVQDVDKTDSTVRTNYSQYRTEKFDRPLNSVLDFENDIYKSQIATQLTDSHYVLNESLTLVNDTEYTGQEVTVTENGVIIELYYQRGKFPYKVEYIDLDQEVLHEEDPDAYPDNGVLQTVYHTAEEDRLPMGAVATINYPTTLEVGDETYYVETNPPQYMTICFEEEEHFADPVVNVKKIYYTKEKPFIHIHYEKVCVNAFGPVDEDYAYLIPGNAETITSETTETTGCTAEVNSDYGEKYTFLGWSRSESVDDIFLNDSYFKPEVPASTIEYYALFEMNYAPYTINYVYQGRMGGNDDSYVGDDADTDEKVYTVTKELQSNEWDENGVPIAKILVENAPAVDDLYKDCVWTINDDHITFDEKTRTVTVTADQTAKKCAVEFRYQGETLNVQRVAINSPVMVGGDFVEAPESDGENPFAYWSVEENGKETARCYDRKFNLRITGDCTVTACYGTTAKAITISDAVYSREQTTDASGNNVDKLYADFILAYMEENGKLLNPAYADHTEDDYRTGLIVEYDTSIRLEKEDQPGATLSDEEKVVYPDGDVLSEADAQTLAQGGTPSGAKHRYICYSIANDAYNNYNRVDRAVSFINSATARHLVLRAYYYVWNKTTGTFEMTDPVYFYLYDIGNSTRDTQQ